MWLQLYLIYARFLDFKNVLNYGKCQYRKKQFLRPLTSHRNCSGLRVADHNGQRGVKKGSLGWVDVSDDNDVQNASCFLLLHENSLHDPAASSLWDSTRRTATPVALTQGRRLKVNEGYISPPPTPNPLLSLAQQHRSALVMACIPVLPPCCRFLSFTPLC